MITSLQKSFQNNPAFHQFSKFLLVGIVNTIFGYGVFATCIYSGLPYPVATLIMTILGVAFNFLTVGTLVFKNKNKNLILQFCFVYAILYTLGTLFIGGINLLIDNFYIAGAINAVAMPPLAFYLNKRFVFQPRPAPAA